MTPPPIPEKVSQDRSARLCDLTEVVTIYRQHVRTISLQTIHVKRDTAILGDRPVRIPLDNSLEQTILPIAEAIHAELDDDQEHFTIITCDHADQAFGYKVIASGEWARIDIDPRILFRHALLLGANSIILMHNHPSTDLTPSCADLSLTARLITYGRMLDIDILDHIIYSPETGAHSLRKSHPHTWPEHR